MVELPASGTYVKANGILRKGLKAMSSSDTIVVSEKNRDKNVTIAVLMVVSGAFVLALVDAMNYSEGDSQRTVLLLLSAALMFGSTFFLRRLRWWLLLYIPGVWIASGVLAVALIGPAMWVAHGIEQSGPCGGIDAYWDVIETTSENQEARIAYVQQNAWSLTPTQWNTYIGAIDTDLKNLRAVVPPESAKAFHNQYIVVLEGWGDVFTSLSNGSYEDQMLFALQEEDDLLEDRQRVLANDCS